MTIYTFKSYPATSTARFDCSKCGKTKRTRTFSSECTVNPFNTNEDGSVKTPDQVRKQSQADVKRQIDLFMTRPLCTSCESALTYSQRKELRSERQAALERT